MQDFLSDNDILLGSDLQQVLSRKGSSRMERHAVEEQETDDASKKIVVKGTCSFLEHFFLIIVGPSC